MLPMSPLGLGEQGCFFTLPLLTKHPVTTDPPRLRWSNSWLSRQEGTEKSQKQQTDTFPLFPQMYKELGLGWITDSSEELWQVEPYLNSLIYWWYKWETTFMFAMTVFDSLWLQHSWNNAGPICGAETLRHKPWEGREKWSLAVMAGSRMYLELVWEPVKYHSFFCL